MTRFLMLFTSMTTRHLSPMAHARPRAPLKLPTLISWCGDDPVQPSPTHEETALSIDEAYREVIIHSQGHMPPKLDSNVEPQLAPRVREFLVRMRGGQTLQPSCDEAGNAEFKNLWLPIERVPSRVAPARSKKRLIVVPDLNSGAYVRKLISEMSGSESEAWFQAFKQKADGFLEVADLRASDFEALLDITIEEHVCTEKHKDDILF